MIEARGVSKTYAQGDLPALRGVDLSIEKGEFVFLSGPSGAGKSTLLKLIFAAEPPTSGSLVVNGRDLSRIRRGEIPYLRRTIGVVFQDFKLIATRTVHENVAYTLRVIGLGESEVKRRVVRMLKEVGLVHKQHVLPQKLSGGEQQRVAIARALVNDPAILLADEPTGNLDQELTGDVMRLLENANARGTTVLVATHDRALMQRYRKRILYLVDGQLADAPPLSERPRPA